MKVGFAGWRGMVGSVLMVGALTYIPALALGPVAEQLQAPVVSAASK